MKRIYSHSRRDTMERCSLAYFFEYYAPFLTPPPRATQLDLFSDRPTTIGPSAERLKMIRELAKLENRYLLAGGILHALRNFFNSRNVVELTTYMQSGSTLVEHPIGGLEKIHGFSTRGTIDFSSQVSSEIRIVDWKMGQSVGDRDSLQLFIYGMWAAKHYDVPPTRVIVQCVFLGDETVEAERRLDQATLRRGKATVIQDIERMVEFDSYGRTGNERAFTPCQKERVCRQCKFQGICAAGKQALASRSTADLLRAVPAQ